jgi:hypothetical protein
MYKQALILGAAVLLLAVPAMAQKTSVVPTTHCDPNFGTDIGANFPGQSNGVFITVAGDCTATPGCDDYFDLDCAGGETITATFCNNGGSSPFDTGISTWNGGTNLDCNDDSCGLQSELVTALPGAAGTYRVRIGGFGGDSGPYTLAFQAPSSCTIVGAVPVTLQSIDVE